MAHYHSLFDLFGLAASVNSGANLVSCRLAANVNRLTLHQKKEKEKKKETAPHRTEFLVRSFATTNIIGRNTLVQCTSRTSFQHQYNPRLIKSSPVALAQLFQGSLCCAYLFRYLSYHPGQAMATLFSELNKVLVRSVLRPGGLPSTATPCRRRQEAEELVK
jgi:hypothetical protein